ncbi:MAG TPA: glycoside hydrolase family 3 N-terminal domain-containing protein [Candidatus Limnocylindrales bacterium]|nr:glycoside hydrolase family 3 N-terminal domain-containing protein [Candidatus Limnocylindrales bacterium]
MPTSMPTAAPTPTPVPTPTSTPSTSTSAPATPTPTPTQSCAERALGGLSRAQRVGQLFLVGLPNDRLDASTAEAIRSGHIGSVWFTATTKGGVAGVRSVADAVQGLASDAATGGVRFYVAANQEGGLIQALGGPGFSTIPSALDQGKLPVATLEADAVRWGGQLRAAGVNLDFAPVFDVVPSGGDTTNAPIGQLSREYGHDPAAAGSHAAAFVEGMRGAGVATTAKHFPGLGRVVGNTDFTADVVDTVTTPDDPYLGSFRAGIAAGVPFVMVALATYTKIDADRLAVFSPAVMRLLRDGLGFRGVIMSDDLGAAEAVASIPAGTRAIDFLEAGGDLVVVRGVATARTMAAAVLVRASRDGAFARQVDDAALRVLEAKAADGLLPCG